MHCRKRSMQENLIDVRTLREESTKVISGIDQNGVCLDSQGFIPNFLPNLFRSESDLDTQLRTRKAFDNNADGKNVNIKISSCLREFPQKLLNTKQIPYDVALGICFLFDRILLHLKFHHIAVKRTRASPIFCQEDAESTRLHQRGDITVIICLPNFDLK